MEPKRLIDHYLSDNDENLSLSLLIIEIKILVTEVRLLSATGTIFSVANYLWPPSEYTIAIVLVTDCHRAVTVIIFTF